MSATKLEYSKDWSKFKGDVVVFILPEQPVFESKFKYISSVFEDLKAVGDFQGKDGETVVLYGNQLVDFPGLAKRMMFVGIGKVDEDDTIQRDKIRQAGGLIARQAAKVKAKEITLVVQDIETLKIVDIAEPLLEGVLLGDYRFLKYKTVTDETEDEPYQGLETVFLCASSMTKVVKKSLDRARLSAECGKIARDMANEPGNGWTPSHFASYAKELAKSYSLSCTVLDKKDMVKLGMGGILGVSQGSKEAPKLVILDYSPKKARKTFLMVGKGLTFDSGGVSLKPGSGMEDMKYDMCGGAAVMSAMKAVAEEQPDVRVVAIIPSTDNMAGGGAIKPGDIITHYGGITSEVINTDAEGRLILADALAYGIDKYTPDYVVDLATLTGAVIIALGHHHTGVIGNSDYLVDLVSRAGNKVGEPVWRLPLTEEYRKQIKSDVADIKNVGGRPAGTITAAAYLEKFVGKTPWLHLDIAGTAWNFTEKNYIPKGPSGTGTRTLIELIRSLG